MGPASSAGEVEEIEGYYKCCLGSPRAAREVSLPNKSGMRGACSTNSVLSLLVEFSFIGISFYK